MAEQEITNGGVAALVIVGAGWAGVTALTVARKYIAKTEKIIIADMRSNYGGHWIDAYDFVCLHQPYQTYTSFDQPWALKKRPDYLATRNEVLSHLQDLGRRSGADELFGYQYIGHKTVHENDDFLEVSFQCLSKKANADDNEKPKNQDGKFSSEGILKIRTKRLINCRPVSHRVNRPFQCSSTRVQSIDIRGLTADVANNHSALDTHYVIVGSGKSAMDAINYIHDNCNMKKTPVSMIAGNGVAFLSREKLYPLSWFERNFGGVDTFSMLTEYGLKWDGTNQASLMREMESKGLLISAVPNPRSCLYGILGQKELEKVRQSVGEIIKGRMSDISDSADGNGIDVVLKRTGEIIPLKLFKPEHRTVVVNCTELTEQDSCLRPLVQDGGRTLDTQLLSISPGASASYLTHAWFLGKLQVGEKILSKLLPLQLPKGEEKKDHIFFKSALVAIHNVGLLMECMPLSVTGKDKTNPLFWFPLWRQVRAMARVFFAMPNTIELCRKILGNLKFPVASFTERIDLKCRSTSEVALDALLLK